MEIPQPSEKSLTETSAHAKVAAIISRPARPEVAKVVPEFLAWFLRTEQSADYFAGRRKGTYVQIIEKSDLSELEIQLPPLKVQQNIVVAAEMAVTERKLSERLASLNWKLTNEKLARTAQRACDSISKL